MDGWRVLFHHRRKAEPAHQQDHGGDDGADYVNGLHVDLEQHWRGVQGMDAARPVRAGVCDRRAGDQTRGLPAGARGLHAECRHSGRAERHRGGL